MDYARILLEAAFLVGVAVAVGVWARSTTVIVVVMAAAWLAVALVEWRVKRRRRVG